MLADVEVLCHRMAILHEGNIRFIGSPTACCEQFSATTLEEAYLKCIGLYNNWYDTKLYIQKNKPIKVINRKSKAGEFLRFLPHEEIDVIAFKTWIWGAMLGIYSRVLTNIDSINFKEYKNGHRNKPLWAVGWCASEII